MFVKFIVQMAIVLLFIPHLPRGIIGWMLDKKIPRSHNIINEMTFGEVKHEDITFEDVQESAKNSITYQFGKMFEDVEFFIRTYTVLSGMCAVLDVIVVFYTLTKFGEPGREDSEMILIALCGPFLMVNLYWGSFILLIKYTMPQTISVFIIDALIGVAGNIRVKTKSAMI